MIKRLCFFLFLIGLVSMFGSLDASAQGCTVSSSTTTQGVSSTACFVKGGNKLNYSLSGTWVGEMWLMRSDDNGATYRTIEVDTSNVASISDTFQQDTRVKWYVNAYTSGTISYSITDSTKTLGRVKYSNITIGSVAYGSLGTSITTAATSSVITDVFVQDTMLSTGAAILNGGTAATTKYVLALYDSTCRFIISTATAGTAASGTNAFQEIAWTQVVTIPRGRYYVMLQGDAVGATVFRSVAASTFVDLVNGTVASTTFGTLPTTCTVPTTLTADKAPIVYVY